MIVQEFKFYGKYDTGIHFLLGLVVDGEPMQYVKTAANQNLISLESPKESTIWDTEDKEDLENLLRAMSPVIVVEFMKEYPQFKNELLYCEECDENYLLSDMLYGKYQGVGGIAYEPKTFICIGCAWEDMAYQTADTIQRKSGDDQFYSELHDVWSLEYDLVTDWLSNILTKDVLIWLTEILPTEQDLTGLNFSINYFDEIDLDYDVKGVELVLNSYARSGSLISVEDKKSAQHIVRLFCRKCYNKKCGVDVPANEARIFAGAMLLEFDERNKAKNIYGDVIILCEDCLSKKMVPLYNPQQIKMPYLKGM